MAKSHLETENETLKGGTIMKNRYEKFVLGDYKNPLVPKGYKHIHGEWYNGFTIEREADGSRFTWIPVESLKANGTLDGYCYTEKFGRRKEDEALCFSLNELERKMPIGLEGGELLYWYDFVYLQRFSGEIVRSYNSYVKHGGQWVTTYPISINRDTRKPESVNRKEICIRKYKAAKGIASALAISDLEECHLLYGAEFDNLREWIRSSKAECKIDSSLGSDTERYVYNNIHFTEHSEWTQEENTEDFIGKDQQGVARRNIRKDFEAYRSAPYDQDEENAFHAVIYFKDELFEKEM